jgi:hypothetical protein
VIDSLLRRLTASAWRRGMGGEHWSWFLLALAAFTLRRARRNLVGGEQVVGLRRGESVLISGSEAPPSPS